jgi:acetylornithine/succinyldiaminopimelate/putrescine aminotransferase
MSAFDYSSGIPSNPILMTLRDIFRQHLAQTSPEPLELEIRAAEGLYLEDSNGKKYLDLISGIGPSILGHGNPEILSAIEAQSKKHLHVMVYGELVIEPQAKLAQKLCEFLPSSLNSVYFVNSGSEAIEAAIKISRKKTGKEKLISFSNAYHGSTTGSLALCGNEGLKSGYGPFFPWVSILPFGDTEPLKKIGKDVAAVFIEPIQGEAGVRVPDKAYIKELAARCKEQDALLVFDEIQTAPGRTGKLFCFEHYDVIPDMICLSKGIGGGLPLGALITSRDIMQVIQKNPALGHITTYGGTPMSCAVGLAVMEQITRDGLSLLKKVEELGKIIRAEINHPRIIEIRGKGLMYALEFGEEEFCRKIVQALIEKGYLTDWFLFCPTAMRLSPPLTITEDEIRNFARDLNEALNRISG